MIEIPTWIVDLDSTVALLNGRDPFDWTKVGEDLPNLPVIRVVNALLMAGDGIVFMSGRMEDARKRTEMWLDTHIPLSFDEPLYMRASGDYRPDYIVKMELYQRFLQEHPNRKVQGVFDDRPSVIRMWASIPLFVMSVNPTCEEF